MKQINRFSILLLAGLVFVFSCAKEQADNRKELASGNESEEVQAPAGKPVTISALLSNAMTKVDFDPTFDAGNDKKLESLSLCWESTDKLLVADHAHPENSALFDLTDGEGTKKAVFSGTAPAGATSYDVSIVHGDITYGSQTQADDGDASHLQLIASKKNISDLSTITFDELNSVLAITALMPEGVAGGIRYVDITAMEADGQTPANIFGTGNSLTIRLDDNTGDDDYLHLFAALPAGDTEIPAGTTLLMHFGAPETAHEVYTRFVTLGSGLTFTAGKLNTINVNASQSDKHAGLPTCDGTSADKAYLIGDKYQMDSIHSSLVKNQTRYYAMVDDVDMNDEEWTPLNADDGYLKTIYFDGRGHKIIRFKCTGASYSSFTGVLNGTVKDVTFYNATIRSNGKVGGVVGGYIGTNGIIGHCEGVIVENSTIYGTNSCGAIGGFVGNASSTFTGCHVKGTTTVTMNYTGEKPVGGFVAQDAGATYTDCSVHATVSQGNEKSVDHVGGFVGKINTGTPTFTRCSVLAGSLVKGNTYVGGFAGYTYRVTTFDSCTVAAEVEGSGDNVGGFTGGSYYAATFTNCSFTGSVKSAGQFLGGFVGRQWNYDATYTGCGVEDATITSTKNADPRVGGFAGQLGSAHIKACHVGVSGARVTLELAALSDNTKVHNSGGFVGVNYGTITETGTHARNKAYVTIISANTFTDAKSQVGGFVGYNTGTIEYADADVTMTGLKGSHIGGFCGYNLGASSQIRNCYETGSVEGNNYTGGFVGVVDAGSIENCTSAGTVAGASSVGGFAGGSSLATASPSLTGNRTSVVVSASKSNVGGFVGNAAGTFTSNYATGNVESTGGGSCGGFAGGIWEKGTVSFSKNYATGDVAATSNCGGLIGYIGGNLTMSNCYATGDVGTSSKYNQKYGSLVGYTTDNVENSTNITITNCYATGDVEASFASAGLIGRIGLATCSVSNCAAWSAVVYPHSVGVENWSSAAVVGVAFPTCTLTDNYRKPDMTITAYWVPDDLTTFNHPNVSSAHPLTDSTGAEMDDTATAKGQHHYPQYPYYGKVETGKTLSQLASTTLGWSSDIWDFTGDLPTLKQM